jgi:hypothetical protein
MPKMPARAEAGMETGFRKRSGSTNELVRRAHALFAPSLQPVLKIFVGHGALAVGGLRESV